MNRIGVATTTRRRRRREMNGMERRARKRSRRTRSERWYNKKEQNTREKRGRERKRESITLFALCVSSVWPRMRGRLSLQFSRLGRLLRFYVSFPLACRHGLSLSLSPSLSFFRHERKSEHVRRSIPSRGTFKCHQPAISEVGFASANLVERQFISRHALRHADL